MLILAIVITLAVVVATIYQIVVAVKNLAGDQSRQRPLTAEELFKVGVNPNGPDPRQHSGGSSIGFGTVSIIAGIIIFLMGPFFWVVATYGWILSDVFMIIGGVFVVPFGIALLNRSQWVVDGPKGIIYNDYSGERAVIAYDEITDYEVGIDETYSSGRHRWQMALTWTDKQTGTSKTVNFNPGLFGEGKFFDRICSDVYSGRFFTREEASGTYEERLEHARCRFVNLAEAFSLPKPLKPGFLDNYTKLMPQ